MEKTTYYQLNKPEAADPLRLEDFNDNANKIDAVLANLNTALGSKAEQSALATLTAAVTGRKRAAAGGYIGDNTSGHTIPLEFTPQFALVVSQMNDKPFLTIATPEFGIYFNGTAFVLSDSCCVENGIYISKNVNYSPDGNYYLAVE